LALLVTKHQNPVARKFGFVGQDNDMATLKQFEANRRNAQKSTGPKTSEERLLLA